VFDEFSDEVAADYLSIVSEGFKLNALTDYYTRLREQNTSYYERFYGL